jgi:hypothetical protein
VAAGRLRRLREPCEQAAGALGGLCAERLRAGCERERQLVDVVELFRLLDDPVDLVRRRSLAAADANDELDRA